MTLGGVLGDSRTRVLSGAHRLHLVLVVALALLALPAVAFAANPHVPASVTSASCPQCHDPHQAAVGGNLLRGGEGIENPVSFCYGCHDGSSAVNVKTGNNNAAFDGRSGHSVEATETGGDLTNVCADCHDPHADSATEFRLPKETVNTKTVTGANNSWCFACHDDAQSWWVTATAGRTKAQYDALIPAPSVNATGYPLVGTFPGATVYGAPAKNAHASIPAGSMDDWAMASREATRVAGDCLWCHSAHRGRSEYDGLVGKFGASTDQAKDTVEGEYAEVCFTCHKTGGLVTAPDIASKALGDATDSGHTIRTAGGRYPKGAPLPCYECHNPHGSTRNNTANISDALGQNLDPRDPADPLNVGASAAKVRAFCFSCHVTYDVDPVTSRPWAWDSTAASGAGAYVAVSTTAKAIGLTRNVAVGVNDLRIPMASGHNKADSGRSCYECHGDVHKPMSGTSNGGVKCSVCHSALNGMVNDRNTFHHVLDDPNWDQAPGTYDPATGTYGSGAYPTSKDSLSCVSCHVDHSAYEPLPADDARADGKAYSLRNSATAANPTPSDTDAGLCLSCHTEERPRPAEADTSKPGQKPNVIQENKVWKIDATWWATSPHNYDSPGKFNDNSIFRANCAKCHGNLQGTLSSGKFSVHFSAEQRLLNALGESMVDTDGNEILLLDGDGNQVKDEFGNPLPVLVDYEVNEEQMCFRCHSEVNDFRRNNATTGTLVGTAKPSQPTTATRLATPDWNSTNPLLKWYSWDWYGTQKMKKSNVSIYGMMSSTANTNGHQTHQYSQTHLLSDEDEDQAYLSDPGNKHVECADCHNHHVVGLARHTWGTSNIVSAAIQGVTGQGFKDFPLGGGIEGIQALVGTNWPSDSIIDAQLEWRGPANTNNPSYAVYEYQICFKCHSSANDGLSAWGGKKPATGTVDRWTNVARDFSVGNQSRHPVIATLDGKIDTDLDGSTTDESIIPGYWDDPEYGTSKVRAGQLADGTNLTPNIWQPGATMYCSDCHGNEQSSLPTDANYLEYAQGPHGSSVEFSLRGPNTWWPYAPDGQLWTLAKAAANDDNGSTSGDDPFCSNCHPNLQANNVHKRAAVHQSATCVRCHTLIPHGGGMSRLIADADSNMPARYAYNNDKSYLYISSFTKASSSIEYSQANCSIANTTAAKNGCTRSSGGWHRPAPTGPVGPQSGANTWVGGTWENW